MRAVVTCFKPVRVIVREAAGWLARPSMLGTTAQNVYIRQTNKRKSSEAGLFLRC